MGILCIVRHGHSQWNLENRFTGWVDVELAPKGLEEANHAGKKLKDLNLHWNQAHTSRLKRAQQTLAIMQEQMGTHLDPIVDSALNERFYGDLQGMNKDEARKKFGEEQVQIWRRSFDIPPPNGESLADTSKRTLPYFREYIMQPLKKGLNVIVAAHGNSLRSIVMELEKLSPEEILKVEINTGIPYIYGVDLDGSIASKKILE